jgi:hypothetical protein
MRALGPFNPLYPEFEKFCKPQITVRFRSIADEEVKNMANKVSDATSEGILHLDRHRKSKMK